MQYGYGICFEDARITRPLELLKEFPDDYAAYRDSLEGEEESEDSALEWLEDFEDDYGYYGFAPFFAGRVGEKENINLAYEDGRGCVVFPENFPWSMSERERSLTEEDIENIFRKWVNLVTDDVLIIQNYTINPLCE